MDTLTIDQYAKYLVALGNINTPAYERAYADYLRALGYTDAEVRQINDARDNTSCVSAQ